MWHELENAIKTPAYHHHCGAGDVEEAGSAQPAVSASSQRIYSTTDLLPSAGGSGYCNVNIQNWFCGKDNFIGCLESEFLGKLAQQSVLHQRKCISNIIK